jgi:hypothetical protein
MYDRRRLVEGLRRLGLMALNGRSIASAVGSWLEPLDGTHYGCLRQFRRVVGVAVLLIAADDWNRQWLFRSEWFHWPIVASVSPPSDALIAILVLAPAAGACCSRSTAFRASAERSSHRAMPGCFRWISCFSEITLTLPCCSER